MASAPIHNALQRIQLGINSPQDERLISSWMDHIISKQLSQQIAEKGKECQTDESPLKRLRSSVEESQLFTAK